MPKANPILVAGPQRSGTTLVQTLLCNALEGAVLLPESHILHGLVQTCGRALSEPEKTRYFYETDDALFAYTREIIALHLAGLERRYPDAAHVVLKDPNFAATLDIIARVMPDAPLVMCVRDPRDIAASFIKIGKRETDKRNKYARRDINFIAGKINASYEKFLSFGLPPRGCAVRYEDIVARPVAEIARIGKALDLPLHYDGGALRWLEAGARHKQTWISELEEVPPSTASIGDFRATLSRGEIAEIKEKCAAIMDALGYS
ncbi:sulfotransferase family protein [Saliniramus fredricksonii]|uniref:Sulfotransferase family protein n=1 Tax=Saliniramus fredricksonii TaxID=1653334 RepID=A0ABY0K9D2_9HYPH|nr:sulfotransferase [Saliniramus fredricksonii]SCC79431.1 Sulfotransferase family protein [Saliniramus fredricksonii]